MKEALKGFEIKNLTDLSADVYFYGDIVSDWWGAWQKEDQYPDNIKDILSEAEGKDLNIYINSGGGSVFAGIAIYNMIKRHGAKNEVKVYVDGVAGSISSVIAFCGTEPPEIPSNAYLFVHNPWGYCCGNSQEVRKFADELDQVCEGIISVYMDNAKEGVTKEDIVELLNQETWLSGEKAAEYFNVSLGEVKEYAAAVGDYQERCTNLPQALKNSTPPKVPPKEEPENKEDEDLRNQIKKLAIQGMLKGE